MNALLLPYILVILSNTMPGSPPGFMQFGDLAACEGALARIEEDSGGRLTGFCKAYETFASTPVGQAATTESE